MDCVSPESSSDKLEVCQHGNLSTTVVAIRAAAHACSRVPSDTGPWQNFVRLGADLIVRMQHQRRVEQSRGLSFLTAGSHVVQEGAWVSAVVLSLLLMAYHTPEAYEEADQTPHVLDPPYDLAQVSPSHLCSCGALLQTPSHHARLCTRTCSCARVCVSEMAVMRRARHRRAAGAVARNGSGGGGQLRLRHAALSIVRCS